MSALSSLAEGGRLPFLTWEIWDLLKSLDCAIYETVSLFSGLAVSKRTENPRIGGSTPPLGTFNHLTFYLYEHGGSIA